MSDSKTGAEIAASLDKGRSPGKFDYSIEINAPPSKVWAVMTDWEKYSEWNPMMRKSCVKGGGEAKVGGQLINHMFLGNSKSPSIFEPEILALVPEKHLRWVGGGAMSFRGEHCFVLTPTETGGTLLRQYELFSGLLYYPIMAFIANDTRQGFQDWNAALKKRAEEA